MKTHQRSDQSGFSLMELMMAMSIMLILMGIVSSLLYQSLGIRSRESRRTDAITSAQAALNLITREVSNAGFGIYDNSITENPNNGIVLADSNSLRVHFRTNINNQGIGPVNPTCTAVCTSDPGEDVTFYWDPGTSSIVRFDPNATPQTSVVVNRISNVRFRYYDYADDGTIAGPNTVPTATTARIGIQIDVTLDPVAGQPNPSSVTFSSEINLRNSSYMLRQY